MNGDSIQRQPINLAALTESQFAEFSRNYQTANFNNDLSVLMRRHYLMFEKTRDEGFTKKRLGCTPAKWFERIAGMHPRQYRIFQLVALSHGKEFTLDAPDLTKLVYDLNAVLGSMLPEVADAYRRLHELAVVESCLPDAKFDDWSMAIYRAHYVRRRPILRLQGEKYLCLHRQLMAERFFDSTVHVLADLVAAHQPEGWSSESKKRTLQVRTEYGTIFEDYVQRLVQLLFQNAAATCRFNYRRADGGECDALVVVDETVFVFEAVHHPWNVEERARALPKDYIKHLEDNITKAVDFSRELIALGALADEPQVTIKHAIPIVVMSEAMPISAMTAPTFQAVLTEMLGEDCLRGTDHVCSVQSLSVTQLENLDRIWTKHPREIGMFLRERSANSLARFAADPGMERKLGAWRHLDQVDQEMEHDLEKYGPGIFQKR